VKSDATAVAMTSVTAYREAMTEFAAMGLLSIWYARLAEDDLMSVVRAPRNDVDTKRQKRMRKAAKKQLDNARTRDNLQALDKLCELVDGQDRIVSDPPIVVPARELTDVYGSEDALMKTVHDQLRAYRMTLQNALFLQVKEATSSVPEDYLSKSRYRNPGQRVVQGQRMM
jgi:hypothetical protein